MGAKAWFARRVVRADVRPSEFVAAWGMGVLRLEDYLHAGRVGRLFWRVASAITILLVVGVAVLVLTLPWHHPDAAPGAPAWWTLSIGVPAAIGMAWLAGLLIAGLRAMHRHRSEPIAQDH